MNAYNLYAYCSDNPVMYVDSYGTWTISIGVSASAWFIGGSSAGYSISFDDNWNVSIQETKASLFGEFGMVLGLAGISTNLDLALTEEDTVFDLEGKGMDFFGFQVGSNDRGVIGYLFSASIFSAGFEGTIVESMTKIKNSFNIKETFEKIKNKWDEFWSK